MPKDRSRREEVRPGKYKPSRDLAALTRKILLFANIGVPRNEFLRVLSRQLIESSGCDAVGMRTTQGDIKYRWKAEVGSEGDLDYEMKYFGEGDEREAFLVYGGDPALAEIRTRVFYGRGNKGSRFFTENGSFWTGEAAGPVVLENGGGGTDLNFSGDYESIAVMRFEIDAGNSGLLELKSKRPDFFDEDDVNFYEDVAQAIGIAVADRRAQAALRERVKELTCLYGIAQIVQNPGATLEGILQGIVELLPPAFQYPKVAHARITLDDRSYGTPGFKEGWPALSSDVVVGDEKRGAVEVAYEDSRKNIEGRLFLKEEQNLLDAVARQVSLIVERRRSEEDRARLEEQLRHADRLATIGQLAAGVAHELNEPLANILGFAQLAMKGPALKGQAGHDVEKIVAAALHGREIVKKLMFFGRQMPTKKTLMDLNQIVDEGLYFLESRCAKEGIEVVRSLEPELPKVNADPSQLHQVLVNLVVNAIQAMPEGGKLIIRTGPRDGYVSLVVEDTGVGMSKDVLEQIFIPFFTTKDVGQGTGLGLPVVHGIVTSHGGTVAVRSEVGRGSRFEVTLPAASAAAEGEGS
jgi:two-component system NtrC family sensor kinase